jgi:hypothetical protein
VPVVEDPVGATEEPRPVDDVRVPLDDRPQQLGDVPRVVLEVRVLDEDHVAGGHREPGPDRRALPLVALLVEDGVARPTLVAGEDVAAAVGRRVVDHHDLEIVELPQRFEGVDDGLEGVDLVVDGNHEAEAQALAHRGTASLRTGKRLVHRGTNRLSILVRPDERITEAGTLLHSRRAKK